MKIANKTKNEIKNGFDVLAKNYDFFNDAITFGLHRLWKKKIVKMSDLRNKNIKALDLCCGSGDISFILAKYLGKNANINAIDYSEKMLMVLQNKISKKTISNIKIIKSDVTNLSKFKNKSIDLITIGFGLRNITERKKLLLECRRVLKKGMPLLILDVGKIDNLIIKKLHNFYFEKIVPLIGKVIQKNNQKMFNYLPASAKTFPHQNILSKELLSNGFTQVTYKNLLFGSAVIHKAI